MEKPRTENNRDSDLSSDFSYTNLGQVYRELVWHYLDYYIKDDDHVLEIGCKSGIDSMFFAEKSIKVTATDPSLNMLDQVIYKSGRRMLQEFVLPFQFDPNDVPSPHEFLLDLRVARETWPRKCDTVFCNFGTLNEVKGQKRLAEFLWKVLEKDALFIATVKNPFCLRESWNRLKKKEYNAILERIKLDQDEDDEESKVIWYPAPEELMQHYQPYFEITAIHALGFVLPPVSSAHYPKNEEGDFEKLIKLEKKYSRNTMARLISDYYIIIMRRRNWSKEKQE